MELASNIDSQSGKTMLRVYSGQQKGATAFFRNRPLLELVLARLRRAPRRRIKALFHAASIGAEPYSFAMAWWRRGLDRARPIDIFATDINPVFLEYARHATYPAEVLASCTEEERRGFEFAPEDSVRPVAAARAMVHVLPPCSFVEFVEADARESYDVVFLMNALTYVSEEEQAIALRRIAGYNHGMLVTTAFHPDTIRTDLIDNGYVPVTAEIEAIHNAWTERIRDGAAPERGSPEYSWVLPPFSRIENYEYKYCSVFRKQGGVW